MELFHYSDFIYIVRSYFPVLTALFFAIKLIGGESKDRKHSFIICCVCALYFMVPDINDDTGPIIYLKAYVEALFIIILISGAGMLAMFSMVPFDRKAFIHSLILAFIVLTNFMLTWHHTVSPQPLFYNLFDEMILVISIIQIMVSSNGIIDSISRIIGFFGRLQGAISGAFVYCVRAFGNIQRNKKSEG